MKSKHQEEELEFVCPHCHKRQKIRFDKDFRIAPIYCEFCNKPNYNRRNL